MANRYWVGGTDNWNTVVGNKWSTTSGGAGGAAVPTSADDVFFDAISGTGTVTIVTTAAVCNSINFTGFTGTLAGSTVGLNVTNTTGRVLSANTPLFAWGSGMTVSFSGTVTFGGNGTGGWIYCNGKTFQGPVTFNNSTATFTFKDTFRTLLTNLVTLNAGAIIATDAAAEFGLFTSTGTSTSKRFNCTNLYLTGTGALYVLGNLSVGFISSITNIYVNNGTTTPKTLLFNPQFGSTNLELGGSGNISLQLGTTKQPAITVTNTGGTASVFNITVASTIKSLVFTTPITWSNAAITTTIAGNMTLVGGVNVAATPNLVFSANATITTAGKSLVTGTLTTNASTTTTIVGVLDSNANITFNSTVNTSDDVSTTGTLTIGGISNLSGSTISAGALTINGASASLNAAAGSTITCSGVLTITQGSIIAVGALSSLYASSITQTGTGVKSITVTGAGSGLYLTGTSALFTNSAGTSTGLTTSITNIYVTEASTAAKTLVFDAQFGSTNISFNGLGNMNFTPGTSKVPNVIVNNPAPASVFNIGATGTISSLVFNQPIVWNNTTGGVTLTINGSALDLSGITLTANPSLVFPNNVTINLTGKTLATGSLTTNANTTATFVGTGITSNAAVILNGTATVPGNINTGTAALTIGGACTFAGTSVTAGALNINGTAASILQSTTLAFSVTCSGVFTITQGSLNTNGGTLTVPSIHSIGTLTKSITAPAVYLTGTSPLYTAGTSGLTTSITNIYVNDGSTTAKTLLFDTQFGSTNLELGGSGNITFSPGATKLPNVTVTNTGGTNSVFNIGATGTISSLVFNTPTPITWNNTTGGVTLTINGSALDLSGITLTANPSLVFPNNVTINLTGKTLATGSLTTNANTTATFVGTGITSNAAVILNGTATVPGNINTGTAALTIGGACTFAGTSVTAGALNINGTAASILQSTSSLFNVTCSGILTITQGSLNTNGGNLTVLSITSVGALTRSITAPAVYLTGTSTLYTAGTSGLTTTVSNIYVTAITGSARTLTFDTQFGSTDLEFGGSGSGAITFQPGTTFQPNLLISSTGNPIFNISATGTIKNLIFSNSASVTWSNAAVTVTSTGSLFTLVNGVTIGALGTPSLVFSNDVTITLAGKSLVTGTLTTNATTIFSGSISSNAAVTLNGTTTVQGNINTSTVTLTIGGSCTTGSVSANVLNVTGASANLITSNTGSSINVTGLTTLASGGAITYAGTFTSGSITITDGSFSTAGSSPGILTCNGILTITQGSIYILDASLYASSITQTGTGVKSITVTGAESGLYLTGTSALFTNSTGTSTGLTTNIINIYVNNVTTTTKTLIFDTQFGSTNLFFNGSGNITFTPGTFKKPNVTVDNPGGTNSTFNILVGGTIGSLVFITPITWNNTASQTLTVSGTEFTLVSGIVFGANGHSSLVFSNNVAITLAGKSLVTGSLTTNANATFDGGINSNAAVTLNGTTSVLGNITPAALTIGGACTFTGTSVSATTIAINGANASIIHSTGLLFNVQAFGVFTITQGSLNTNGGTLTAASITSSGASAKSITVPNVYLTGTATLYTAATGLSSTISNIYVTAITGSARTLTFDTQFGSTDLEFGGSGSGAITFQPGATFQPNLLISSTGNPIFNISTAGTIKNLIFSNSAVVIWSNSAVTVTSVGSLFTLVSGVTIGAAGTPSLVFSNDVIITLAGKSLVTGNLTTNGTTYIDGVFNSNANVTLNATGGQSVNFPDAFTITGTGVLTISGATGNFSGTITVPTITINSGTILAGGNISCGGTTTISGNGTLQYNKNCGLNTVTINSGNIYGGDTIAQTFTCTGVFTLANGGFYNENNALSETRISSITVSGSGGKNINASNLYLTGTGTLFTPGAATGLSASIPNIYVTNTSVTAKTLSFTTEFGSSNVYLQGTLITFGGGTQFVPNVYVTSTSSSTVSFLTGIFTDLTFSTGTNVTWNNATAGQIITIYGNLTLISTMSTSTTTPTLLFMAGTGSQTIFTAGKTFYVGSLIIDGTIVEILDNFNNNIPVTVQNSGILYTKGFLTTGLFSILTNSTCYTSGSAFSVGTLTLNDGSIVLGSTSHTCTGAVASLGFSNINNAVGMNSILNMNSTLAVSGGSTLEIYAAINVLGLTTITNGSTININNTTTIFSAVTITSGFINISGVGSKYVCTGVTTLTEGDLGNNAGNLYTGTLTLGGGAATKNIYAPNLYFTGTGALYTHGSGAILSNGPENIYITDSSNNSKSLLCNTQFPYTANIPIYLGGSGSGSISIAPGSTFVPVIYVTNTGGANISITGTATITSLIFANTSNAAWNNGAITLNIQADLDLGTNPNMTVVATPSIVFNVGLSYIYLNGKSLKGTVDVTAYASVLVYSDFSSTSTVTVTDGFIDVITGNFTATTLDIKSAGTFTTRSSGTLNLASITSTGGYYQYRGNLICTGAITVPGIFYTFIDPQYPGPLSIQCTSFTGSTVNCNIYFTPKTIVTLTGTGPVWTVPATAGGVQSLGIIRITNTSIANITFAGGGWVYYELIFDRGTSPNNNIISGSNTFTNLRDLGTAAHFLVLTTGTTQTVGHFDVKGNPENYIAIARSGASGVASLLKSPAGLVICDWVTVTNVTAENLNTFYSGPNSTLSNALNWNDGTINPIGKVRNQSALGAG